MWGRGDCFTTTGSHHQGDFLLDFVVVVCFDLVDFPRGSHTVQQPQRRRQGCWERLVPFGPFSGQLFPRVVRAPALGKAKLQLGLEWGVKGPDAEPLGEEKF